MAGPLNENYTQDGSFRLPPQRRAWPQRPRPLPAPPPQHGSFGYIALRCSEAALRRRGSGWRPVATPAGPCCQPLRLRDPYGTPRLVLRGWPPRSSDERPASKESPKGKVCKTSCTAVTGNGCWITGMAAQAAGEVAGRRKEAEECS
ncbi:large ribosomal subunit protein mL52 isoform X1 [Camelus dromedarius]|uniref:large ribosomal subunit protein mL52 isoform X1 n=1 Tax=Camelus dromedarius TaxID=9838 RepID=UPI003119F26A